MPRDGQVLLYGPDGAPLMFWAEDKAYCRRNAGFLSPHARERLNERMGWGGDERPPVVSEATEAAEEELEE